MKTVQLADGTLVPALGKGLTQEDRPDSSPASATPRLKSIDAPDDSRLHRAMTTKSSVVALAVWFAAASLCLAANPQIGTWKLNEKKSKFAPGTGKNTTVVYQSMLFQTKVTVNGVDGHGNPTHSEWMGAFDGKDHAVKGNPLEDARAYRKIDERTLEFASKKGGKVTLEGRVVVAADGKSRTVTTTGTMENGKKFHNTAVYDKQ